MKKINVKKIDVIELSLLEKKRTFGGDYPQRGMGYYAHLLWDVLTVQYTGETGHLMEYIQNEC